MIAVIKQLSTSQMLFIIPPRRNKNNATDDDVDADFFYESNFHFLSLLLQFTAMLYQAVIAVNSRSLL